MILFMTCLFMQMKPGEQLEIVPGEPVPHGFVLDQLLTSNKITSASDSSLFDFLFDTVTEIIPNKLNYNNIDISLFDLDNVRKIVESAKTNYHQNFRRAKTLEESQHEAYNSNLFFVSKAFDMMKQSIYATRERLISTLTLQQKFEKQMSYNIGILYGTLSQLILKMDNMFAQMNKFPKRTHFIWFLILYEKLLAADVDATAIVHRMFEYQTRWIQLMRPEENDGADGEAQGPPKFGPRPGSDS